MSDDQGLTGTDSPKASAPCISQANGYFEQFQGPLQWQSWKHKADDQSPLGANACC